MLCRRKGARWQETLKSSKGNGAEGQGQGKWKTDELDFNIDWQQREQSIKLLLHAKSKAGSIHNRKKTYIHNLFDTIDSITKRIQSVWAIHTDSMDSCQYDVLLLCILIDLALLSI